MRAMQHNRLRRPMESLRCGLGSKGYLLQTKLQVLLHSLKTSQIFAVGQT